MKYQIVGDYVLEYENIYEDYVRLVIWQTHCDNVLPFSEVIAQINLPPTHQDTIMRLITNWTGQFFLDQEKNVW